MNKIKKIGITLVLLLLLIIVPGCSNNNLNIVTEYLEKDMFVGDKILLEASTKDDSDAVVNWSSSDELVAIVSEDGLVVALSVGDATITAQVNESKTDVLIHVSLKEEAEEINLELTGPQSVLVNESITISSKITPETFNQKVLYESSDKNIATINEDGVIKGLRPGVVTIKARSAVKASVYKEITILVRTGDGIQDVIYNYIHHHTYIPEGTLDLSEVNKTVVNLVKNVEKSVIGVSNSAIVDGQKGLFTGTGGIYKKEKAIDGYKYTCFTNHHVIEDSQELKVYLGDVDEYVPATVVKSDANMDLAVITFISEHDYTPLTFGKIGEVNKGDFVAAIGNPGGFDYYGSVTFGMVSCPNRLFKDRDMIYVQHDAPINPGNSGGPLFNLDGEVIGINTMKFASSQIEGMGFSIAMEKFLSYLE